MKEILWLVIIQPVVERVKKRLKKMALALFCGVQQIYQLTSMLGRGDKSDHKLLAGTMKSPRLGALKQWQPRLLGSQQRLQITCSVAQKKVTTGGHRMNPTYLKETNYRTSVSFRRLRIGVCMMFLSLPEVLGNRNQYIIGN